MKSTAAIHWAYSDSIQPYNTAILSRKEQIQANAFRFDEHRELYLAAHYFLRKVLSYYVPSPLSAWRYDYNYFGKPFISNALSQKIFFNLSHTQGMIVCAVSHTHDIGIDVELKRPINNFKEMSHSCFHSIERNEVLRGITHAEKEDLFFVYWTLKEAAIKAWGEGLSTSLQSFYLYRKVLNQWGVTFVTPQTKKASNLQLNSLTVDNDYQLAIAIQVSSTYCSSQPLMFTITDSNSSDSSCWNTL
ncbi:4'-phosphopantetheinyl transferase family protein [Leucothrix arctica]|uniref:4'-phosphopantetheinyl transferase domain-containing protein n=1 Tax=Leucothrix arctica TaxID=1481894 RepID=A0A317CP43_9GAMM|nr:4'-phosphopantetheinyl transferase superfamily protein [Leucothrix arctica]PWQ99263.1 hypothetical protein DKT75_01575 [Leucothrix arctica]